MPANLDIQGADQIRTGVSDFSGLFGVSPRAREQVAGYLEAVREAVA